MLLSLMKVMLSAKWTKTPSSEWRKVRRDRSRRVPRTWLLSQYALEIATANPSKLSCLMQALVTKKSVPKSRGRIMSRSQKQPDVSDQ